MKKILFFFTFIFLTLGINAQTNISGIINDYGAVTSINVCPNQITIDDASPFSVGDTVLILQMKGATINVSNSASFGDLSSLNNAGNYENNIISAISGNTLTFATVLQHTYDVAGKVQIVGVRNYSGNVAVNGLLTAMPWNGQKGGILIFNVAGTLTLNANIDVSGRGFVGGDSYLLASNCSWTNNYASYFYASGTEFGAGKGEGVADYTIGMEAGRGKQLNAGGGGNDHNSGGGGGAGFGSGGQGGNNSDPGFFLCKGNSPGVGGLGLNQTSKILFGGGGGAGHANNNLYFGGDAGGVILINAASIVGNTNNILANGQDGFNGAALANNDGGSGGGAGGSIYINTLATATNGLLISASGGSGQGVDDSTGANTNRCHGPGGGAGGGLIYSSVTTGVTTNISGGLPGVIFGSTSGCNGTTSGALAGQAGTVLGAFPLVLSAGTPFSASGSISATSPPDTLTYCQGQNATITIHPNDTVDVQWQVNSTGTWVDLVNDATYSGVDDTILLILNLQPSLSGNLYRAFLSNSCSSLYLDSSALVVNANGVVTTQPTNKIVCTGDTTSFYSNGSNMVTSIWQSNELGIFLDLVNGPIYSNVDSLRLNILNTTTLDGVLYRLRFFDECGNTHFSNSASLTLTSSNSIISQSTDTSLCEFLDLPLYIETNNSSDSIYWQVNTGAGFLDFSPINNNDTLFLNNISNALDGNVYRAILNNQCNLDTSENMQIAVFTANIQFAVDSICDGDSVFLATDWQTVAGVYYDTLPGTMGSNADTPVFYTEDFETGAPTWTLNTHLGMGTALAFSNFWEIGTDESAQPVGTCSDVVSIGDASLYVTSQFFAGAIYADLGPTTITHKSAESGDISTIGKSGMTLSFEFIGNGDGLLDNASLDYSIDGGTNWLSLDPSLKSILCGATASTWEARSYVLPSTCDNISNLRIRFVWENDLTTNGTDPSFALNNVVITNIEVAVPFACDSLIETTLIVSPTSYLTINDTICTNEIYTLPGGTMVEAAGTYVDSFQSVFGCDSVVQVNLTVNPSFSDTILNTSCNPVDTGTVIANDMTISGCDSVTTTITTLIPSYSDTINLTSCNVVDTGIAIVNDTTSLGCDSITTTITTLIPSYSDTINLSSCNEVDTGVVIVNDTTTLGCDSITTTITILLPSHLDTINLTSCNVVDTGTVIVNDTTSLGCDSITTTITTLLISLSDTINLISCNEVDTGTVIVSDTTALGCDSITTTITTLAPSYMDTFNVTSCNVVDTGIVIVNDTTSFGCDSITTTITTLIPSYSDTINLTSCNVIDTGIVIVNDTTTIGCDSITTTITTLLPSHSDTINLTSCNLVDTGIVIVNDTTTLGCDSITTTITTLLPSHSDTINLISCNEIDTGTVIVSDTTTFGCDSITTTITTLAPSYMDTFNVTSCNVIDTGIVIVNDTTSFGCDSITTTITTLIPSYSDTINLTSCNVVDTGIVIVNDTTTLGCDSITTTITLLLPSYSDTINLISCNEIDTGTVIINDTTSLGCDSITTTITSLVPSYMDTIGVVSCIAADTGIVIVSDTTTFGCDSITTTITTFAPSFMDTLNLTSCNIADTGIVIANDTTIFGCDSITTTVTTLLPSSSSMSNDTICDNTTFTLPGGDVVSITDVYIDTLVAANTCDSLVTTNLTVLPSILIVTQPTDFTACQDSSALFYITATGTDVAYQWQINTGLGFNNIPGATNDTLMVSDVSTPIDLNGAEFRVVLNSYCGNTVNSNTFDLTIEFNVVLNSNPTNAVVCEGTDTSFTATTNGNETNAQWQVDNGLGFVNVANNANYSGANTLSLTLQNTPLSFNTNAYRLIVSDNCGIVDTTTMATLTVNPLPAITLEPTNQNECLGNNVQFVMTATNAVTYQWQVNTGLGFTNIAGETNDILDLIGVTQAMNGNTYQCVVTNNCGMATTIVANLTVSELGSVVSEPSDVIICPEGPGFNFDLTLVTTNINIFQWQIDTGAGFVNIPVNFFNITGETTNSIEITVPYDNVDGADFRVQYIDDCGFGGTSSDFNVRVSEPDPVDGIEDVEFCQREIELIEVDYGGVNYVWNDADQTTGRFFEPTEAGEYIVTFMQNSSSCLASDTINVSLRDCLAECVVAAPTGFSPTGSAGVNDVFRAIYGCELDFFEMIVVNRWGEIMYKTNNSTDSWDGTYKGVAMPVGNYAWYISYNKEGANNKESISGNVTLVR